MLNGFWVVARTKAQREQWAADNALRQGFEYYLPKIALPPSAPAKKRKVADNSSADRISCLFPGYIFIYTQGSWRALLSTFGITALIMHGQRPAVMPSTEVDAIRAREGVQGLITLPEAKKFMPGDVVRVTGGLFQEYVGIYAGDSPQQRAKVLLEFLGRRTPILIGVDLLEAVA